MPIEIQAPDGGVIEFPDGTPDDKIQGVMKGIVQKQQADKFYGGDAKQANVFMQALGGAKHGWDRGALGLKGLVTDLSPEDKEQLAQGKAFVDQTSKASNVGEIAADALITSGPAMRLIKGAKWAGTLLPKAVQALRGAQTVGAGTAIAGAGAATGALTSPEDRESGAVGGAVGGLVGAGAGKVLNKAVGGVARNMMSEDAKALAEQGINVPLWKATDNPVVRKIAEAGKAFPVIGGIMQGQERKSVEEFNKALIKQSTPMQPVKDEVGRIIRWENKSVEGTGQQAVSELKNRFNRAYDALYEGRTVPLDGLDANLNRIVGEVEKYNPGVAAEVKGAVAKLNDTIRPGQTGQPTPAGMIVNEQGVPFIPQGTPVNHGGVTYETIKRGRYDLDDRISAAWRAGDEEKATALEMVRSSLNDVQNRALPPEVQSMKAEIDKAYTTYKRLERAAASLGGMKQGGVVTPAQQMNAVRALDSSAGKSASATGRAPGQQFATLAHDVMGSQLPEVGPGTAEKMGVLTGLALNPKAIPFALAATPTGQKIMMGNTGIQKYARSKADVIADILRTGGQVDGIERNTDQ
jgi:hypothetical protein